MLTGALAFQAYGRVRQGRGSLPVGEVMLARAVVSLTIHASGCWRAAGVPPPGRRRGCCSAAACSASAGLYCVYTPCRPAWRRPRCVQITSIPPSQPCLAGPCWVSA